MAKPQQPELARSRKTPALDPDATETVLSAAEPPGVDRPRGPIPEDNRPGHHPPVEQDKPDGARFVAKVHDLAAVAGDPDHTDAVQVGPSVEAATAARSRGAAPGVPSAPPSAAPPASSSPAAEGLATLAGVPWRLAAGVLQRLRDRL